MVRSSLLIVILFVIFLQSCSEEEMVMPPLSELECISGLTDLDTVKLDSITLSYVSYTGNEILVYKTASGNEVKFEPIYGALNHSYLNNDFELRCMSGDYNDYKFNREQFALAKKCEALNLQFFLNVYTEHSYQLPLFYDQFSLLLHSPALDHIIDTSISIRIVTSLKGNLDLPAIHPGLLDTYQFTSDTSLLQVSFQNVYFSNKPANSLLRSLFFTKELGMIAFQDLDEVLWVFDRFE